MGTKSYIQQNPLQMVRESVTVTVREQTYQ